jgi:hypothetical protein
MREEANPRKIQRRALDYGASPAPITLSRSGLQRAAVATAFTSRTLASLVSSYFTAQRAKSIASETKSKAHASYSKQTAATEINRYFLTCFPPSAFQPLALAKVHFSERFFPFTAARAN